MKATSKTLVNGEIVILLKNSSAIQLKNELKERKGHRDHKVHKECEFQ
jgi:hypothetical protein